MTETQSTDNLIDPMTTIPPVPPGTTDYRSPLDVPIKIPLKGEPLFVCGVPVDRATFLKAIRFGLTVESWNVITPKHNHKVDTYHPHPWYQFELVITFDCGAKAKFHAVNPKEQTTAKKPRNKKPPTPIRTRPVVVLADQKKSVITIKRRDFTVEIGHEGRRDLVATAEINQRDDGTYRIWIDSPVVDSAMAIFQTIYQTADDAIEALGRLDVGLGFVEKEKVFIMPA